MCTGLYNLVCDKSAEAEKDGIQSGFGRNKADKDLLKDGEQKKKKTIKTEEKNNQDGGKGRSEQDDRAKTRDNHANTDAEIVWMKRKEAVLCLRGGGSAVKLGL